MNNNIIYAPHIPVLRHRPANYIDVKFVVSPKKIKICEQRKKKIEDVFYKKFIDGKWV